MSQTSGSGRITDYLELLAAGELDRLGDYYTDDVVWHVGGTHPLAGTYRGRDALIAYFRQVRQLTGGTLRVDPEEILQSDKHTVMFTRVTAKRDGKELDVVMAQIFAVGEGGRWSEYWAMPDDSGAVDEFWTD